ncbi:transient receptor potential cation channel protein painless-like [Zophobas morio]|uniref:transient receptor potential cation channel protein painless-like n=1 Tax=Zophobas morio TaxID=2755281 RepID=UPI003082EFE9
MSTQATEIHIRQQTKLVLDHLEKGELEKAQQIILKNKEILRYNFGLINFLPLIPRIRFSRRIPKNNEALKMVMDSGFLLFMEEDNVNELLFFAAAKCDTDKLKYCINNILQQNPEGINQVREGDTSLMFLIKYGDITDEKYPECMKILVDAGVDVNRNDYFSHNPISFLVTSYSRHVNRVVKDDLAIRNLKMCIEILLETRTIDIASLKLKNSDLSVKDLLRILQFNDVEYYKEKSPVENDKVKLFKFLINNDEKSFMKSKELLKLLDADDGNNTFLQLCCEKNLKEAAKFLIQKGVDVCKTTERNPKTPLELAARRNNPEIFEAILNTNKIVIDEPLFLIFLRGRPKHIKGKYFDEILKYKNLDVNLKSNNGNTPLHYAIILSSTEAIQVLLQRGASLIVENNSKKCPLDYISSEDLENYFNKCILPDGYNHINNGKYEVALNYRNLIDMSDTWVSSELTIVDKICNSPKLYDLLNHPLISSFINIKWKLAEPTYKYLFIFHVIFYIISILSFINLNLLNYLALPLAFIYGARIWLTFSLNNKFYEIVNIFVATLIFVSFFFTSNILKYHLGLIATIFMTVSFQLFWQFNPNFPQVHAILINIVTHLVTYLFYILTLIVFFGATFHIFYLIWEEDHINYSNNFLTDIKEMTPLFYLLFVFGVFVGVMFVMTIINSVAYLQQNSENLKKNFQIVGCKNTLIFLKTVEILYKTKGIVKNSLIFDEKIPKEQDENINLSDVSKGKQKKTKKIKNRFLVNFFINMNKFSSEKLLSINLTDVNVSRIKKVLNR